MLASVAACALVVQLLQPAPAPLGRPQELRRSPVLTSLYVSFATLQALDVHSTTSALSSGAGREANPAMRGIAGNPAALIGVKAATAVTTIWMSEKIRKKHPRGALVVMAAINTALAAIVSHNYSVR